MGNGLPMRLKHGGYNMKNLMALVLFITLALPISQAEAARTKHKKNAVHHVKSKSKSKKHRDPSSIKKKKSKAEKKIKKSKKRSQY